MTETVEVVFLLGDDQDMDWGSGADVLESIYVLIFVDGLRGDLLADDFVEDCGFAVHHYQNIISLERSFFDITNTTYVNHFVNCYKS